MCGGINRNQRGRCADCGRSFNLTRSGELRRHKCHAAAPLLLDAAARASSSLLPQRNPNEDGSRQQRVWAQLSVSLTRVYRDGLAGCFEIPVHTDAPLAGLELGVGRDAGAFPPSECGKVLKPCAELRDAQGGVVLGIGDGVLNQPPLERTPADCDPTMWLKDRLNAYGSVGWEYVPVLCHGPLPTALRRTLENIDRKLGRCADISRLSATEALVVQRTLRTITDRALDVFEHQEAAKRNAERHSAATMRDRALVRWRRLPADMVFDIEDDDDDDDDTVHLMDEGYAEDATLEVLGIAVALAWLAQRTDVVADVHPKAWTAVDGLFAARATSKGLARALAWTVRDLKAIDFRRTELDPIWISKRNDRASSPGLAACRAAAYSSTSRTPRVPSRYVGEASADRLYDLVASRFARLERLELPVLPGATELGLHAVAEALRSRLRVLKLVDWHNLEEQSHHIMMMTQGGIRGLAGGDDGGLQALTGLCDNLHELVLHASPCPHLPPVPRAWFEQRLGCLETLDLGHVTLDAPLRPAELPHLVSLAVAQLPDLRGAHCLKVLRVYELSQAAVANWANANPAPGLESLALSGTCLDDEAVEAICCAFPGIATLDLRNTTATFATGMGALRSLKRLDTLVLRDAHNLTLASLPHLPPTLTSLDLSGCNNILRRSEGENLERLQPHVAATRFTNDVVVPMSIVCPMATFTAHIDLSPDIVLCTDFPLQAANPNDFICPRCFWRINDALCN